ncbi:MAG: bifunctional folylpolyglutamate synthase/dihydrofolate synthase [Lachnospiraceae bacterium]|nr:bifunctional folylpolyglutamate synthase/dihydrofolate synthase [Lachnospiraceae bacterium]
MTYDEMEREINDIPKFGANASLSNLTAYLDILDHPEASLRVIHVAGTNGKGSVCAYLESVLREAGYRTALFTSPHLVKMSERFRINFQICEEEKLIFAWETVRNLMERGEELHVKPLTFFEILFLMALLIFSKENVDYCIMETGLGGRLDATVLTRPILCVITSISYDHTAVLGETIEAIAGEKAGIIKNGVPVVVLDEENGAFPVIEAEAEKKKAPLYRVLSKEVRIFKNTKNKIDFSINSSYYKNNHLSVQGMAEYQIYNGALAAVAMKILFPDMDEKTVQKGLMAMRWEGRMEQLMPGVYVDGAHNPGAVRQICRSVRQNSNSWILLFAVCGDKDYSSMIRMLGDISWKKIYITTIEETRGADVSEVTKYFREYTECPLYGFEKAEEAFGAALQDKEDGDNLLCLGSLYLVGELKRQCHVTGLESEDVR